ncbi:hypothetical protein [Desulfolutivibrio sulfoxidireducens]|uniref:hypothetical protein n=1 Tax=Desulfolutivibrio sulfoxidireducens TaxID=2773299 RepID=UPI00159D0AB6|nr:hypothetical protein [Desulfolutivibrio sulfoxidireducens]QLA19399.1 hypothetical protein GD604_06385 [Desulfolutivibrio sulfoxidireducens]
MFDKCTPNVKGAIIGAIVAVSLAILGGVFKLGYYVGEKDLDLYKKTSNINPQKLLDDLAMISSDLGEKISCKNELEQARASNKQLSESLRKTQSDISNKEHIIAGHKTDIEKLKQQIKLVFQDDGDIFTVKENESISFAKGLLTVGLKNVSLVSSDCTMNIWR